MKNVGCKIVQNFQRPDPALVERFRKGKQMLREANTK